MSILLWPTRKRPGDHYSSISVQLRLEGHALGWRPSRTRMKKSPTSSTQVSNLWRHISRNTPPGSTASMLHGLLLYWSSIPVLVFDSNGVERHRIEGYLPKDEFRAQLELGLARIAFKEKKWADAERGYSAIVENYPQTAAAPEAVYWSGVSHYRGTNDHTVLGRVAQELEQKYPQSIWTKKALPFSGH